MINYISSSAGFNSLHRTQYQVSAILVAAAFFMENLDATVITTALPTIAHDFTTTTAVLSIAVASYLVAMTLFIPLAGWAAERLGARRVFSMAIALFTLSSIGCAMSHTTGIFILMRIFQGLSGAMMVPVGRIIVLQQTPKTDTISAIAILTWPGLIAPVLGPLVGGFICTHWSWQWIFLINVPLGMILLLSVYFLLEHLPQNKQPFDAMGFVIVTGGIGLFMVSIELADRLSLISWEALFAVSLILLVWAAYHLCHKPAPLFRLSSLSITTFRASNLTGSLFRLTISSMPFILPLMFQLGFGQTPVQAGAMLLWLFAGNLLMKTMTTWLLQRFGFRNILHINGLFIILGMLACAQLTAHTAMIWIALLLLVCGMTRSMQYTALTTLSFADIAKHQLKDATTLSSVLRQMSMALGVAICGLLLQWLPQIKPALSQQASLFSVIIYILAGITTIAWLNLLRLPADAGNSIRRQSPKTS